MGWLITALPFIGMLLANILPVDAAVRAQHGSRYRHGWRELLALVLLAGYAYGALGLAVWLFWLLKPQYEYGPPFEGYWTFFAVAISVAALYLSAICLTGRWLLRLGWRTAWKMTLRVAMYNLMVLLATWLIFIPNY